MDMCIAGAWYVSQSAANIMRRRHQLLPVALLLPRIATSAIEIPGWKAAAPSISSVRSLFKKMGCVKQLIMGPRASGSRAN